MDFLENLRLKLHKYYLKRELKKNTSTLRQSTPFEEAGKIGILFNASDMEQEKLVLQYVDRLRAKNKKKVTILGLFHDKGERDFSLFKFYSLKDLDWMYRPKKEDVKLFMDQKFDISINFMDKPVIHADYIMALSKSQMRVGRNTNNTDAYDLIINEKQNDPAHFVGLVDMYLRIFNNKPNEPQPV